MMDKIAERILAVVVNLAVLANLAVFGQFGRMWNFMFVETPHPDESSESSNEIRKDVIKTQFLSTIP